MSDTVAKLIEDGVSWIVKIIVDAAKGEPAPTQAEIEARINAAIDARKRDAHWLDDDLAAADKEYGRP